MWYLVHTAECVYVYVCWFSVTGGIVLVSCEQPADSDCVKFSWSYLTCQQSEDLSDQMCLGITPQAAWEHQYSRGVFVCVKTMQTCDHLGDMLPY